MQRSKSRKNIAKYCNSNTRFESGLHRARCHDDVIDKFPTPRTDPLSRSIQHLSSEQLAEVVPIDPLHLHHADAIAIDEVMDIQQIILLDLCDLRGNPRHAGHRFIVGMLGRKRFGRKYFQRYRQCEVVGPAALGQIDHALAAFPKLPKKAMVFSPTESLMGNQFLIGREELVRAGLRNAACECHGCCVWQNTGCRHRILV